MPSRKTILLSCVCAATFASSLAYAQTAAAPSSTVSEIEELVVTAEKREQSLQDVPVAISAFTDERRELVGINSVQDLTNFTPGLAYRTGDDRIALRGIGRFTNNRSVDAGVAMYYDGFFTSSVTAFGRYTLFVDRTEALRGPQGTLYGRNSIGGALNLISQRPTDEFEAEIRGLYGNYDTKTVEGAVSGPLFGTVRGRAAASWSDIGKGTFRNLNPNGEDEGNRGLFWTVEGQLDGNVGDGKLEWWLKADTTEWHTLGRGPGGRNTATYGLRDVTTPFPGSTTPNAAAFGLSAQLPGNTCQFCFDTDDGNYIDLEDQSFTLNAALHLDGFDVKYIGGQHYYDYRLHTDVDGTSRQAPFLLPAAAGLPGSILYYPRRANEYQEEVWWFSNELNIASTGDGPLQWLFGVYQFREGSNGKQTDVRYPDDPRFDNPLLPTPTPGVFVNAAPNPERRYFVGLSESVNETYAGFGQADWQFTDELKLTAGLRYTYDRKRSFEGARVVCNLVALCVASRTLGRAVDVTDAIAPGRTIIGGVPTADRSVVGGYDGVRTDPTTGIRHRTLKNHWSGLTGTLGLDWKPDADTLAYAKYSRGYKAGGFTAGSVTLTTFVTTDEETIDAYEVGLKRTFARRLQANVSAFYYEYQDIQIPLSFFNPAINGNQTQFVNLPKARNYGFEVESIWQPIDNLQILANYSYLNAKIREGVFSPDPDDPRGLVPGAQLAPNQFQAASALPPLLANGLPNFAALNQELKGQSLPQATPHRFTINTNYTWLFDPGSLSASLTYVYKGTSYSSVFNRYYNKIKPFGQTDARLLFRDAKDKYTVIASLKNVFDTRGVTSSSGTRITAGPNTGFVNRTIGYVPPRTYSIELQLRY